MSEAKMYEDLYLQEKKKLRIFIVTCSVLVVIIIGLILALSSSQSDGDKATIDEGPTKLSSGGPSSGSNGGERIKLRGGIEGYFNEDGSVNKARVNNLLSQVPSEYHSQMAAKMESDIDMAVNDGTITKDQASELLEALGL